MADATAVIASRTRPTPVIPAHDLVMFTPMGPVAGNACDNAIVCPGGYHRQNGRNILTAYWSDHAICIVCIVVDIFPISRKSDIRWMPEPWGASAHIPCATVELAVALGAKIAYGSRIVGLLATRPINSLILIV
jgi:hypothetical protein